MKMVFIAGMAMFVQWSPVQAVNFGLFGDVAFNNSDAFGDNSAFTLGDLDFYATQAISDRSRGFIEFVFENTDEGIVTDLERLWVSHTFKDEFTLAAGRFDSPLGAWNRTFHHGAILQDTVSRPFFLDVEDGADGVLPVHVVGLMATGDFVMNRGILSYELALANGPSLDSSSGLSPSEGGESDIDINNISDPNDDKSVALRVIYKPDLLDMKIGVFAMSNTIAESADGTGLVAIGEGLVSQTIVGLDVTYTYKKFDVLGEYYRFDNKNKVGVTGSNTAAAYFVQVSYWLTDSTKAVLRSENLSFDDTDSYFQLLGTREATHNVFALRYDVDESNSLKFELNRADVTESENTTSYRLQWAFLIP